MKFVILCLAVLLGSCTDMGATDVEPTSEISNSDTLYVMWNGKTLELENGENFPLKGGALLLSKHPNVGTLNVTMSRSGLSESIPYIISELTEAGFEDVVAVDSAVFYSERDIEKSLDKPSLALNVRLSDGIFWSDNFYNYKDLESFIKELAQFDNRQFVVILNIDDVEDRTLRKIKSEIEAIGFKTKLVITP